MKVRFLGFSHTDTYRGHGPGCDSPWLAREVRDIPVDVADRLISDFPEGFVRVGGRPSKKTAIPSPSQSAVIESPPDRPMPPNASSVLDGSIASIRAALESGDLDGDLDSLQNAEEAGKTRKGVIKALDQRRAILKG